MKEQVKLIDSKIKDEVLRYPFMDLVRKLFPDVRQHGRSVMCNPIRGEKKPSLSCFRDCYGIQRWKDHGTGEFGDNLDFYRKVYPDLGYVEALDRLSLLVLGRSVYSDYVPGVSVPYYSPAKRMKPVKPSTKEEAPALNVIAKERYDVSKSPKDLVAYTRGRGISDEVASVFLWHVTYENLNRKGNVLHDPVSGLPMLDKKGEVMKDEARYEAVALPNDIGGYSLRVPPGENSEGFKGANISFISTIHACGDVKKDAVRFVGKGDGFVTQLLYNPQYCYVSINPSQGFIGVPVGMAGPVMAFLDNWIGRYIDGRELVSTTSVVNNLCQPLSAEVDVVEGLFDAVSDIEFERLAGRPARPARDMVVLNSISNLHWAVPFLAVHQKVRSLLDNDMRTSAGKKAFDIMKDEVESFSRRIGSVCTVQSDSGIFYPHKDINDFLKVKKGFMEPKTRKANETEIKIAASKRKFGKGKTVNDI